MKHVRTITTRHPALAMFGWMGMKGYPGTLPWVPEDMWDWMRDHMYGYKGTPQN